MQDSEGEAQSEIKGQSLVSERPMMMIAVTQSEREKEGERERGRERERPFDKTDSLTPRYPAQHRKTGAKTLQFR